MNARQASRPSRARAASPRELWASQDSFLCGFLLLLGVALWATGWFRAAGELTLDEQVASLNMALAGMLVSGAAFVLWFLRGRRAISARRRLLIARRRALLLPVGAVTGDAAAAPALSLAPRSVSSILVGGAGLRHFHRADCPMAVGRMDWAPGAAQAHSDAGRSACGVCRP